MGKERNLKGYLEKIKTVTNSKIGMALILNFSIYILLNIFFTPVLKSDDYYMSSMLYGIFSGEYDYHLVYSNVIIGVILKGLMNICPVVPWYTVFEMLLLFWAFTCLTYLCIKENPSKSTKLVLTAILLFFGYEGYIKITFTKTAAFLVAIGVYLCLKAVTDRQRAYAIFVQGMIFVIVGVLLRNAVLLMVLGIMAGIPFYQFVQRLIHRKKRTFKRTILLAYMLIFVFPVLFMVFASKLNAAVYAKDEGWNKYGYTNQLKAAIIDHSTKDYAAKAEEYKKLGVSENDLDMIYQNQLYDPEFWNLKQQEKVASLASDDYAYADSSRMWDISTIWKFFKVVPLRFFSYPYAGCLILMITLLLILNYRKWFMACLTLGLLVAENYYMFVQARYLQNHVDVGIIFSACLVILYVLIEELQKVKDMGRGIRFGIGMIGLAAALNSYSYYARTEFYDYGSEYACNEEYSSKAMEKYANDKKHLYFTCSRETVYAEWVYGAYGIKERGYMDNVFSTGSGMLDSRKKVLKQYHVKSPMKEMVDSNVIRLLISDDLEGEVEKYQTYIREHYCKNAKLEKIDEEASLNIYRCSSGREKKKGK